MKTSIVCVAVFMLFMALGPAHAQREIYGGGYFLGPTLPGGGYLPGRAPSREHPIIAPSSGAHHAPARRHDRA
jgi:hypothetical protein